MAALRSGWPDRVHALCIRPPAWRGAALRSRWPAALRANLSRRPGGAALDVAAGPAPGGAALASGALGKGGQVTRQITTGATLACSFGLAPSVFNASPSSILVGGMPAGTITDHVPGLNIPPFGMCACPGNPAVAAATAAALGVLTPAPCIPVTPAPWMPGAFAVLLSGRPSLPETALLNCSWGGAIRIVVPSQFQTLLD
ncbi:hypothetical protein CBR67_07435 [Bordetella hinzii]|nr:hypothetical protein CBR67_07435 [Bordetella hinzii]